MEGLGALLVVPVALVAAYFLIQWKAKGARRYIEQYLQNEQIDAEIEKVGIPPLYLWLRNRKGDSWVKLRFSDGSTKWARLRSTWGTTALEMFD